MSRMFMATCLSCALAGSAWAEPTPSSRPLVEPRASKSDSVRVLERARADSIRLADPSGHMSGGQALAVGIATTLAPAGLALLVNPPGSNSDVAWEGTLTLGIALGVFAGPAIGLASGNRGDLATRGLTVRGIAYSTTLIGLLAVASAFESNSNTDGYVGAYLGLAGATVGVLSCIHDLSITPSAVGPAKPASASVRPIVDEKGRLALRATF